VNTDRLLTLAGTSDTLGAGDTIPINVYSTVGAAGYGTLCVHKITLLFQSGTATTIEPRLLQEEGAENSLGEVWRDPDGPSPVGSVYNEDFSAPGIFMTTDSGGNIHLYPGPDAGSNNVFEYRVWLTAIRNLGR
jgi:hypothetical protein